MVKKVTRVQRKIGLPYVLLVPALLLIVAVIFFPLLYSLYISFFEYNLTRPDIFHFIGINNYIEIFQSSLFWEVLGNTLYFSTLSITLIMLLGLWVALVLNERFKGRGLMRVLILIPWAIPAITNAMMWKWILDPSYGVLNGVLKMLGLISAYRPWLSDLNFAVPVVSAVYSWNEVPIAALLLLTGLQAIPADLYEAAKVDGAGIGRRFRHITLPLLRNTMLIVLLVTSISSFQAFTIIYVLTGGGPIGKTNVLAWYTYTEAFGSYNFGLASALAYVTSMIMMVLAYLYIRVMYKEIKY